MAGARLVDGVCVVNETKEWDSGLEMHQLRITKHLVLQGSFDSSAAFGLVSAEFAVSQQ